MSASAAGFIPGSGAGIVMLESLDSAQARGARIYAEVIGGHVNSGGQRGGGSMTAPNPEGVVRCIPPALDRKRVVEGKSVSVRVDCGGRRINQKQTPKTQKDYEKQQRN